MAASLYQELVLDHHRAPRNRGALPAHTHAADGANPLCGDSLRVELIARDDRIVDVRFSGEACAIATATASMLSERVVGLDAAEIAGLATTFEKLVSGATAPTDALGALNALAELERYPSRRRCALLPWATLRAALAGEARATTEPSQ